MGLIIILLSVISMIFNYYKHYYTAMIFVGGLLIVGLYKVIKYKKKGN